MSKVTKADLVARFKQVQLKSIKLLTDVSNLKGLIVEQSAKPENSLDSQVDVNQIYIQPNNKKVTLTKAYQTKQEKHKNYKPGPFALFYELNQGQLNKQEQVWYFKNGKQIFGPTSSYNMDIAVYFKNIREDTRVAYKDVNKFVKYGKIKSILQEQGLLEQ